LIACTVSQMLVTPNTRTRLRLHKHAEPARGIDRMAKRREVHGFKVRHFDVLNEDDEQVQDWSDAKGSILLVQNKKIFLV
jgi:hypothetical protein